jgi:hypothetical protein
MTPTCVGHHGGCLQAVHHEAEVAAAHTHAGPLELVQADAACVRKGQGM